jgi:hypothetical protein
MRLGDFYLAISSIARVDEITGATDIEQADMERRVRAKLDELVADGTIAFRPTFSITKEPFTNKVGVRFDKEHLSKLFPSEIPEIIREDKIGGGLS